MRGEADVRCRGALYRNGWPVVVVALALVSCRAVTPSTSVPTGTFPPPGDLGVVVSLVHSYPVGNQPLSIVFDGECVWTASFQNDTVSKLARDGRILGTFHTGGVPGALGFDGQHIWVGSWPSELDLGHIITELSLSGGVIAIYPLGLNPGTLSFDDESMWVSNLLGDTVTRLNPRLN